MFVRLWLKGVKEEEIAKRLNIRVNMVPVYVKVLGLPPRTKRSPPNKKLSDEDLELIKEMWMDGATIKEIADYFNVHESTVLMYLHAMGLKRRVKSKCPNISKEELEKLCREGLTDKEIAEIYNTSSHCIARLRQKYGISKRILMKQRYRKKLNNIVETIINILNDKGFTTSVELREKYGIHVNRNLLNILENLIDGINYFKLRYLSTAKYSVFHTKYTNTTIIYLKGYEKKVATFLQRIMVNRDIPSGVFKHLLKANNVPKEIIELFHKLL